MFYAADSERDPSSLISLEMVDGRLRYHFRSPTGQVTMETRKSYALNAVWYKVGKEFLGCCTEVIAELSMVRSCIDSTCS